MTLKDLRRLVAQGESSQLELKRSTGELQEALQTTCAFLNGRGGHVVIGAKPDGTVVGQQVSDKTLRDVFHRVGLIEKWGRGTNRVIEQCLKHGIPAPEFKEITGATVVTFRVEVGKTAAATPHVTPHVTPQVARLLEACQEPRSREELQRITGLKDRMHVHRAYIDPLVAKGWLEMTIPDKPKSRLQRYRATTAGLAQLQGGPERSAGHSASLKARRRHASVRPNSGQTFVEGRETGGIRGNGREGVLHASSVEEPGFRRQFR